MAIRRLVLCTLMVLAVAIQLMRMAAFAWMAVVTVHAVPEFVVLWLLVANEFVLYMTGEADLLAAKFAKLW